MLETFWGLRLGVIIRCFDDDSSSPSDLDLDDIDGDAGLV